MPVVSVVIPLYNKGPHIARTLGSVLSQTFNDFEVIVVDDGSTDNGPEVVRGFSDPRIRLVRQENQGVSAARNCGVNEAKTDLIAFLDADDEWMPLHLEKIISLRKRYPEAGMYTTAYKIQWSDGKNRFADYQKIPSAPWEGLIPNYFTSAALGEPPVNASVVCIPKKIYLEVGGFPVGYWWSEDHDLYGKIAMKYKVAFSWELGSIYRHDATNRASDNSFPWDYEEPFLKTAKDAFDRGDIPPELIGPLNEYLASKEIFRAMGNIYAGNSRAGIKILKQCKTKWFYKDKIELLILAMLPFPLLIFIRNQKRRLTK